VHALLTKGCEAPRSDCIRKICRAEKSFLEPPAGLGLMVSMDPEASELTGELQSQRDVAIIERPAKARSNIVELGLDPIECGLAASVEIGTRFSPHREQVFG
jgi:hypothetical protein